MRTALVCGLLFLVSCGKDPQASLSFAKQSAFPVKPMESLTTGSTCKVADEIRYPERIKYCERDVSSELKYYIIDEYDQTFDFSIGKMNRQDFKIDHLISLCMGGSNEKSNLWPQHKSLYQLSDPIEEKLCRLLAKGTIEQAEAISKIEAVKHDIQIAPRVNAELDDLLD